MFALIFSNPLTDFISIITEFVTTLFTTSSMGNLVTPIMGVITIILALAAWRIVS